MSVLDKGVVCVADLSAVLFEVDAQFVPSKDIKQNSVDRAHPCGGLVRSACALNEPFVLKEVFVSVVTRPIRGHRDLPLRQM